jgi:GH24 family phage-related lysozyme (muramidase)
LTFLDQFKIDHPFLDLETVRLICRYTPARTHLGFGRYAAYRDRGEHTWRIGYGSLRIGKRFVHGGDKATELQITTQFIEDLKKLADLVVPCVYMPINKKKRSAIISYAHSIGISAFKECYLRELINSNASKNAMRELQAAACFLTLGVDRIGVWSETTLTFHTQEP